MLKRSITATIISVFYFSAHAVTAGNELKWGRVSKAEINLTHCEYEPDANAIVLNDVGVLKIEPRNIVIRRHRRIKVLNENGFNQGNIEIPFYAKDGWESVKNVKAQTINVDDKGKLEKISISGDKIYEVDQSGDWKAIRFTFPSLKKGSIIEYSYVTYSKSYTFLDGWMFQSEIPTLHSAFSALIPESMDYRILFEGKRLIDKYGRGKPVNNWELNDVFSIKEEPYVANYLDYAEKIRFQLAGYKRMGDVLSGNVEYVTTMTTWEKLAQERLQAPNYSSYLNKGGKAREILSSIRFEGGDPREKIKSIYNHVKDNYKWNGRFRLFTKQSFSEFLKAKSGNSAEINLFLNLLLKNAEFKANPVLLSTRKHGKVSRSYPFLSQFNNLICNVNLDGEDILMDATNPNRPYNLLSKSCLNEFGYLLDQRNPRWVNIKPNKNTYETTYVDATLDQEGNANYKVNLQYNGYQALALRERIGNEQYREFLETSLKVDDLILRSAESKYADRPDKPYELSFTLGSDNQMPGQNNMIYFQPILINSHRENPFKSDSRYFPVDYSYPFKEKYILVLQLPDNLQIVEAPANAKVSLPDNLGSFIYASQIQGNKYQLSTDFRINKATIPTKYYKGLQEFYNIMVAKLSEVVVIKKVK